MQVVNSLGDGVQIYCIKIVYVLQVKSSRRVFPTGQGEGCLQCQTQTRLRHCKFTTNSYYRKSATWQSKDYLIFLETDSKALIFIEIILF